LIPLFILAGVLASFPQIRTASASGTIYIRADGSIDPPTPSITTTDNVTYTFIGNITSDTDGIVIERDNVVIDGADYAVRGTGIGTGIVLSGRSNVAIRNVVIKNFFSGIELKGSTNNTMYGNNITANNGEGIWLYDSSKDCSIHGNQVTNNSGVGIRLGWTGLYSGASSASITGNIVAFNNESGIHLSDSDYNSISGNNVTNNDEGIVFYSSSNNSISGNNITDNSNDGIWLGYSSNNSISGNNITNNSKDGIYVIYSSTDNDISKNRIATCDTGIDLLEGSSDNTISDNMIANNNYGFFLSSPFSSSQVTSHNSIVGNTITANYWGIGLQNSSDNTIYHNFFTDNQNNVDLAITAVNVWDDAYPSGGNYWSRYNGADLHSGLYQNETGSDGIGDTSYTIDANNEDHYPLMGMFSDFNVTSEYHVQTICNSTISDFQFNDSAISFNVSGENGTSGFCRSCIPTVLMNGTYHISINDTEVPYVLLPCSNADYSYLYFTYSHSTITIPEFPLFLILPLFMIAALLGVISYRRKRTL
jgi:parallel beta-helix repeat protein